MENSLISYIGVDKIDNFNNKMSIPYKLEGKFRIDDSISNIHSFSLGKEHIDTKVLEIFEETNLENESFFKNLIIINNKFEFDFEYSSDEGIATLKIADFATYESTYISLEDYSFENLDISLFTNDLFCTLLKDNEIYYLANITIYIT